MKSKSFQEFSKSPANTVRQNKTYDFVNFYKTSIESSDNIVDRRKSDAGSSKENVSNKLLTPKRLPRNNKTQNGSVNITKININGNSLPQANDSYLNDSKVTSTPYDVKKCADPKVKSIIKNRSEIDSSLHVSDLSISSKPKKRNKSVSFMLDDTEEVIIKRTKSEEIVNKLDKCVKKIKKLKKIKKKSVDEKENERDTSNIVIETLTGNIQPSVLNNNNETTDLQTSDTTQTKAKIEKKKLKKHKKSKNIKTELENTDVMKDEVEGAKIKKDKKKKRHIKSVGSDNIEVDEEPAQKFFKRDVKPEIVAQDLENLNIGDNAHTLTNLLNEMTVADRNKKNKNKKKNKDKESKHKKDKLLRASNINSEGKGSEEKIKGKNKKEKIVKTDTNTNAEGTEEKEKVKWVKRKWNKDKKGGVNADKHLTSVIIENLPVSLIFTYKKRLTEHFEKFGMIRQVGIAEMYPTEEPKPVFTTSINFYSEDAAEKALEDDNSQVAGVRVRVKRPLPPTLATLVVRSYAELTEQALSSAFSGAGRIRNIRLLVKGKKSSSTAFIEFDGPKSVERAIEMAEEVKIGGKKIYVAKFELRTANKKVKQDKTQEDNENGGSSTE